MILTSYMDETGHSKDELQKFNGMAGLLGEETQWLDFEDRWEPFVKGCGLPYIHMKEMRSLLNGWNEPEKRHLSEGLWKIIKDCHLLPFGSIIPMEDYRQMESDLKEYFADPYYLAMQDCMAFSTLPVTKGETQWGDSRVAMVFSDQVEFRHEGQRLYDAAVKRWPIYGDRVDRPTFRNMRCFTPLQAADLIAYEVYKEYDRVYYNLRPKPRHGYQQIEIICREFETPGVTVIRHNKETLGNIVTRGSSMDRLVSKVSQTDPSHRL